MGLLKYSFRVKSSKKNNYSLVRVNNFNEAQYNTIFNNLEEDSAYGLQYAIDMGWMSGNKLLKRNKKKKK